MKVSLEVKKVRFSYNKMRKYPKKHGKLLKHYTACSGGHKRSWIIYCWLVWCERKTLLWLKIYDRLRPNEHADNQYLTCFKNFPRQNIWDTTSINATYINAALMRVASYGFIVGRFPNAFSHQLGCFAIFCRFLDICSFY